ncbi:hypothetical protein [Novosphingobium sp. P6W]|uniref:hypothetical protein n=1 Tax=Novosphingobium sp. P6W TaxID=1609758 RepID=UPI0005C2FC66|nr:hypothetical protein [Novosphingobium sp. P6W]AXB75545.1 hypothetical protein TQ38_002645 [Novosphingobium sp. P6W]KIS30214.1 hypothetical protein TQ38_23940 [Novosphingobium sp. P6W]
MDRATSDAAPDVIAARVDRATLAQGPGSDLGLYAATPGAFPAITAASASAALLPSAAGAQDQFAEAFAFRVTQGAPAASIHTSAADAGNEAFGSLQSAPLLLSGSFSAPTSGIVAPDTLAFGHGGNAAVPSGSMEQVLVRMDAQGALATSTTAQAQGSGDGIAGIAIHSPAAMLDGALVAPVLSTAQQAIDLLGTEAQATLANALGTAHALAASVEALAAGQVTALNETVDRIGDGLGTTLDAVAATGTQLIANTSDALDNTAAELTDTLGTVADTSSLLVSDTADTLASTVATQTASLGPILGGVTDTLGDLAGSDPAGGVSTLTSLVSAADVFAVNADAAPPEIGLADGLGLGGMLDSLAPPALDAVLLGADDPLHDALSHFDDHHLGLG